MGRAKGTTSAGRRKIEMRRIESDERRQVTFSKRRAGLFKKASELATLCGAEVAVVVFSRAGRAFCFGSPSVDRVADRFLLSQDGAAGGGYRDDAAAGGDDGSLAEMRRCTEELRAEVAAEQARVEAVGAAVARAQGGRKFWWEADVEAIGEGELWEFERALTRLRANVERRADALLSTPPLC